MGMFDEIKIKLDLPLPEELKKLDIDWKEVRFQTKNLENLLDEYLIDNNGLHQRIVELEYVEYSEAEKKQNRKNKKWFPIHKDVIEKSSHYKKIEDFHGSITFYHYDELDEKQDFSVDFKANFIYGKLDKIDFLSFEKFKSRKLHANEWKVKIEQEAKKPWNRFKHYANYLGWKWLWRTFDKYVYRLEHGLGSIRMFVIRHML